MRCERVSRIGGVDMHKLAPLPEGELRRILRALLDTYVPDEQFAFGSDMTLANYIFLKNHVILLDEARRWGQ